MSSTDQRAAHGAAPDAGDSHGGAEHLIKMANDIGDFFRAEPNREDAIAGIANHVDKFWTPRMRQKLAAHLKHHGSDGLNDLPREAIRRLLAKQASAAPSAAS